MANCKIVNQYVFSMQRWGLCETVKGSSSFKSRKKQEGKPCRGWPTDGPLVVESKVCASNSWIVLAKFSTTLTSSLPSTRMSWIGLDGMMSLMSQHAFLSPFLPHSCSSFVSFFRTWDMIRLITCYSYHLLLISQWDCYVKYPPSFSAHRWLFPAIGACPVPIRRESLDC